MRLRFFVAFILAGYVVLPAHAQTSEVPDAFILNYSDVSPSNATYLDQIVRNGNPDNADILELDARIAAAPPHSADGLFLALMKINIIGRLKGETEALTELAQLVTDYPNNPIVLQYSVEALTFTPDVQIAAESWLKLARVSPEDARTTSSYFLSNIKSRMKDTGRDDLADQIALEADNIGYSSNAYLDNSFTWTNFKNSDAAANTTVAADYLRKLDSAPYLQDILMSRIYEKYWPSIEARGAFDKINASYLWRLEDDYDLDKDAFTASVMMRAMNASGWNDYLLVKYLAPLKLQIAKGQESGVMYSYWVPPIATALLRAGRQKEAIALYEDSENGWAEADYTIKANITSNFALLLLDMDQKERALEYIDKSLSLISKGDNDENSTARIYLAKAQILNALGRKDESSKLMNIIYPMRRVAPMDYAITLFDNGQYEAARDFLVEMMVLNQGGEVLGFVQPDNLPDILASSKRRNAQRERLLSDAIFRKVFDRYARLLPKDKIAPFAFIPRDHMK